MMTLFDITEKEDSVSFIQVNRLSRMRTQDSDDDSLIDLAEWIRRKWYETSLTLDFKGWSTQRTEINIGRFVTRLFQSAGKSITDKDRETFVNSYKSVWKMSKDETKFELVKGEDIRKWYLESNYQFDKGQLSNSCMRYERCQSYLDIYVKNPDVCSLLILHGDDPTKIVGRALLWKAFDSDGKSCDYMDRIYTNFDSDKNLFVDWANKNSITYTYKVEHLEVRLQESVFSYYPYMDTFGYLNKESKILSGDENKIDDSSYWELKDTSGKAIKCDRVWSDYEGEYIDREDAVYCHDLQDYCHVDHARYLEYMDRWVSENNDDIVYSDYDGEYYYERDCKLSKYLDSYIYSPSAQKVWTSSDDWDYFPEDGYSDFKKEVEIGGKKYLALIDSLIMNPLDGSWSFKNDPIEVYWCQEKNGFVTQEFAEKNGLDIDRSRKQTMKMSEYITSTYPKDVPSEEDFLKYLENLEPAEGQISRIRSILSNVYDVRNLNDDELWRAVKFCIFNMVPDSRRDPESVPQTYTVTGGGHPGPDWSFRRRECRGRQIPPVPPS